MWVNELYLSNGTMKIWPQKSLVYFMVKYLLDWTHDVINVKTTLRHRFDVIMALSLRRVSAGMSLLETIQLDTSEQLQLQIIFLLSHWDIKTQIYSNKVGHHWYVACSPPSYYLNKTSDELLSIGWNLNSSLLGWIYIHIYIYIYIYMLLWKYRLQYLAEGYSLQVLMSNPVYKMAYLQGINLLILFTHWESS